MASDSNKIDKLLLLSYIKNNQKDENFIGSLLEWFSSTENIDYQKSRYDAKKFIKLLADDSLDLLLPKQEKLVEIFEPLEEIFRAAISIKSKDKGKVRDHLNHTIRDFLFSDYILKLYNIKNSSKLKKQLAVAAIFHDIAYPIEKFKKVANSLADNTFEELLNSKGRMNIVLEAPENLLEVLNFWGGFNSVNLETDSFKKNKTKEKISYIYCNIIAPSIAGQGLFEAQHCLSSVILFLRPIILDWKDSNAYWQSNINALCDICIAMAFHDRKMLPIELSFEFPLIGKILKIADELQEWSRDKFELSYIKSVDLLNKEAGCLIGLEYEMKDRSIGANKECVPEIAVSDKLFGLLPICDNEYIFLRFVFPKKIVKDNFKRNIEGKFKSATFSNISGYPMTEYWNSIQIIGKDISDTVEVSIEKNNARINFS